MPRRSRKSRQVKTAGTDTPYALSRGPALRAFILLFCTALLAFGVYAGYRAVACVWRWRTAQAWTPVPARIVSLEFSKGRNSRAVIYETRCEYTYRYGGKDYLSSHVGLETGAESLGEWHQDVYGVLAKLKKAEQSATCYVDPDCPERAVLFRDLRLPLVGFYLVFATGFIGLNLPIVIVFLASFDSAGLRRAWVRQRVPALSWLMLLAERPEAGHRLRSGLWYWWFGAVFVVPGALIIGIILSRAVPQREYPEIAISIFLIVFILLVFERWVRWSRSGRV